MANLYEITKDMQILIDNINMFADENNDEVPEEMMEAFEMVTLARDEKIENTLMYIKNIKAEVAMLKAEEKSLAERRKALENSEKRITDFLKMNLDGETFKSSKGAISYRKSTAVNIVDFDRLKVDYVTVKSTVTANKTEIKKAIAAGEVVEGAELIEKQNINIK